MELLLLIMRKLFILLILIVLGVNNSNAQGYTRVGNTFTLSTGGQSKAKGLTVSTKFKVKDSDGKEYTINVSSNGSAFIKKTSKKTGKEYRKYLGEELSQTICKEIKISYKPKKK